MNREHIRYIEETVARQRAFFQTGATKPVSKRLAALARLKAEIQAIKQSGDLTTIPDSISKKKKLIATYMREHPGVTNKSLIAREVGVDKNTVRRYYDEVRKEM